MCTHTDTRTYYGSESIYHNVIFPQCIIHPFPAVFVFRHNFYSIKSTCLNDNNDFAISVQRCAVITIIVFFRIFVSISSWFISHPYSSPVALDNQFSTFCSFIFFHFEHFMYIKWNNIMWPFMSSISEHNGIFRRVDWHIWWCPGLTCDCVEGSLWQGSGNLMECQGVNSDLPCARKCSVHFTISPDPLA